MKARLPWKPSKREEQAMMEEISRQIKVADNEYWLDVSAMMLWAVHTFPDTKYFKKRLLKFFKHFDKVHRDLVSYYELKQTDAPWLVRLKLKELGVDIEQWSKGNYE